MKSVKPDMKINIQKSISTYMLEKEKIKKMFPEKFFDSLEDNE